MYCSTNGRCQLDSPKLHMSPQTVASMLCAVSLNLGPHCQVCPMGSKGQKDKNQKGQGARHLQIARLNRLASAPHLVSTWAAFSAVFVDLVPLES